jgi:Fe-Mn family superoxide dismutase
MSPNGGGEPTGELLTAIVRDFGSFDKFKELFTAESLNRFGSGWAWLVKGQDGKLKIYSTPNQDNPLMIGDNGIFTVDVWEHSYYLKFQNRRPEYIEAFWNVVDWNKVSENFNS